MTAQEDLSEFWCWNKECPDYGQTNNDNIIGFGHSPNGVQRYRCKTCEVTFTETKGTIFYRRHTPRKDILEALAMLADVGPPTAGERKG